MSGWVCPYCGAHHAQFSSEYNWCEVVDSRQYGKLTAMWVASIACANAGCGKLSLKVILGQKTIKDGVWTLGTRQEEWNLLPEAQVVPQPSSVPDAIYRDYSEAARVLPISPKASATLARRCLQAMVRNFCGIDKWNIKSAFEELERQVNEGKAPPEVASEIFGSMDAVREISQVGAHPELQDDVVVDVEPDEARALKEFIELLFQLWYVRRDQRIQLLERTRLAGSQLKQRRQLANESKATEGRQ